MDGSDNSRTILREAMKSRSVGQKELAEMMGVNQSTISTGMRRDRIGLGVFAKLLDALDYDVVVIDRESGESLWKVET